jgi:DNA-binding transcriptional LysR family regulator
VRLTPAGRALLHHARVILQHMERMRGELGDYALGLKGHVRLLTNTSALSEFLPETLSEFLIAYPNIDIDIEERPSYEMVDAVSQGLADAGICSDAVEFGDLETFPFGADRLVLILPPAHPLTARRQIAFHEVLDEELVGMSYGSALQQYLGHQAGKLGRQPRLRVRVNSFEAVGRMVENGVGVAVIPESAALRCLKSMDLGIRPLTDKWALRRLIICCRRFDDLPVHARRLIEHLTAAGAQSAKRAGG